MIITCEACNTSFNLDEKMLKPEGSKVRCSVCSKVFTAYPRQAEPAEPTGQVEKTDSEPGVSEMPLETGGESGSQTGIIPDGDEIDADLFFDEKPQVEGLDDKAKHAGDEVKREKQDALEEELDAELDLFLDSDTPDESDATMIADLEDDDLDFSLDMDSDEGESDLSDFAESDFDLDVPLESEDDPEGTETIIADLDDDPLEMEDDLDLSGLENMLEDDKEIVEATEPDDGDSADRELSLALEDDFLDEDETEKSVKADETEGLELDFGSDDIIDDDGAGSDDQEIDLTEIEKMLEEPKGDFDESVSVPEQDLELDVESGLEAEKWMSKADEDEKLIQDEEIDLTELEEVLDDVDLNEEPQTVEDPELALDIQESVEEETVGEVTEEDGDIELDFSDFESDLQFVDDKAGEEAEPDDMELKFELETDGQAEQTLEDEPLAENVSEMALEAETPELPPSPPEPVVEPKAQSAAAPVKKGANKFLVFLLILILLGGGGYGVYYLVAQQGVEIPFLSDFLKTKVDDPGNLKLSTYEINSKFVDNANVGKLFVISGKVKNGYTENRGMITLQGKLFSAGKVPVNQEKVYCGNIMSDLELSNLEWDKIKARLSNRLGDNRSNVKIEPGASIPFMVVFSGLPDDLEEFTIEVTGSTVLK